MQTTDPLTNPPLPLTMALSQPINQDQNAKNTKNKNKAVKKQRNRISKSIFWQTNKPIDVDPQKPRPSKVSFA